jgi:hypothetical protein
VWAGERVAFTVVNPLVETAFSSAQFSFRYDLGTSTLFCVL